MTNNNKYDAPWTLDTKTSVNTDGVRDNSGDVIGTFWKDEMHIAALIAAAPEMLEVLEEFVKWDKDYPIGHNPMGGFHAFNRIMYKAHNIIAKAKGETNGYD
ncbi:hypothetical protein FACS1894189_3560 [Planctomycetales bacterium]|nr:hypothetical protein FACS1894189_3560 [Planctomycetales bacterium]